MKTRDLIDASDMPKTWEGFEKQREKVFKGDFDHTERREAIKKALYQTEQQARRRSR
jgi:hypothetical protein